MKARQKQQNHEPAETFSTYSDKLPKLHAFVVFLEDAALYP